MNSSSHIVIIIICLNLLQTRISYLNHLAIFPFRVTLSQHHPLVGFSSSKFAPNKEETSCWWSHSKVYMPNKEEPLVGFSQNVCRARAYASCWLFPKSLKVYAEQGRTSCWLFFFQNLSKCVCLTRDHASCWLYHIIIMCHVPSKELSLLLASVLNKVLCLLSDDQ